MGGKFFLKPHFLIRPSSLPCHGTRLLPATLQYVDLGGFWCSLNQTRKGYLRLRGKPDGRAKRDCGVNRLLLYTHYIHIQTGLTSTTMPSNHSQPPRVWACTRTHARTHTHANTCTHTHARAHTHTHTHTHTQTHTHTPLLGSRFPCLLLFPQERYDWALWRWKVTGT